MNKLHFQLLALAALAAVFWCTEAIAYDRYYGDAGAYYPYSRPVYSYTYSEVRVYGAAPYAPAPPVARYYGDTSAAGYYGGSRGYDSYYAPRVYTSAAGYYGGPRGYDSYYSAPRVYGYRSRYWGNGRCNGRRDW